MSIETTKSKTEIDEMFKSLCNNCSFDGIKTKAEKCRLIRNTIYNQNYGDVYPESFGSALLTDCPMLCVRMKSLEDPVQKALWTSELYIADEKIDGIRCFLAYDKEYPFNNGFVVFSRDVDETTLFYRRIDLDLLSLNKNNIEEYKSFLLDCELVLTQSGFKIICFDCIHLNQKIFIDEPWLYRRFVTETVVSAINDSRIVVTRYEKNHKLEFFNLIKREGGEGVIFKNIDSNYNTHGTRSVYNWIKVKGSVFDYSLLEDSIEGFVYEQPKETDSVVSLFGFISSENSTKIAEISKDIILKQLNIANHLNIGTVIEFNSSFFSLKKRLFMNNYPIKIRFDKSIRDCYFSKEDIIRWGI